MRQTSFYALPIFILLVFSCGTLPSLDCKLSMTEDYIESPCGLVNGVRFEQLKVDSFYRDNIPKIYRPVLVFEGTIRSTDHTKQNNRLYFKKANDIYQWKVDSLQMGNFILGKTHDTLPIDFKSDTWYFVNFHDQRYEAFLYIDKKGQSHIHKIALPTNF
jgi:hypothetical protein